jgi:hypothetical protein
MALASLVAATREFSREMSPSLGGPDLAVAMRATSYSRLAASIFTVVARLQARRALAE